MALSDVLFEAVEGIEHYRNDPFYKDVYGPWFAELDDILARMRLIRERLDAPPEDH